MSLKYNVIQNAEYLLIVDDSEIKGWYYDFYINKVKHSGGAEYAENSITKNIIAHLPLNNSPILESVDLLPPLPVEDAKKLGMHDLESYYGSNLELTAPGKMWIDGFDIGYNKAKEKYKYTEEDLRKIFSKAWELRERYNGSDRNGYEEMHPANWKEMDYEERQDWFFQQELKSFLKYPTMFECQYGSVPCPDKRAGCLVAHFGIQKTKNSQGQTILLGNWIY